MSTPAKPATGATPAAGTTPAGFTAAGKKTSPQQSPSPSSPPKSSPSSAQKTAAAKSAQPPAPAAAVAAKPVKKRGGCLKWFVLLLIIVLAAGYYLIKNPQVAEKLTGKPLTLPSLPASIPFISSRDSSSSTSSSVDSAPATSAEKPSAKPTAVTPSLTPQPSAATSATPAATQAEWRQLRAATDEVRSDLQAMQSHLAVVQQQVDRLAARLTDSSEKPDTTRLQLQLIGLQLEIDGDSSRAAQALTAIAQTMSDVTRARMIRDEAARLRNLPPRQLLLTLIKEARQTQPAADTASSAESGGSVEHTLKSLFNVRQVASTEPVEDDAALARLELLLLTRRDADYWQQLTRLHDRPGAKTDIVERLYEYGAPDYRLRLSN